VLDFNRLRVLYTVAGEKSIESKHTCPSTRAGKCGTVPLSAVNTLAKKVLNILTFSSLLDAKEPSGRQMSWIHDDILWIRLRDLSRLLTNYYKKLPILFLQGDPPTCCYAAPERKSIQVEFWILTHSPKSRDFCTKNSTVASLMSCQMSDLRKTLKYSQSRDLEGIQ